MENYSQQRKYYNGFEHITTRIPHMKPSYSSQLEGKRFVEILM